MDLTSALALGCARLGPRGGPLADPLVGIASPRGEIVALSDPTRAGSAGIAARWLVEFFADRWLPGDLVVTNDPFHGSYGVGEFTAVRPVDGGYAVARCWCGDIGGFARGGVSPDAVDTWGEGARFTALLLRREGAWRREAMELLELNSRTGALLRANLQHLADAAESVAEAVEPGALATVPAPSVSVWEMARALKPGGYRAQRRVEVPHDKAGPTIRVRLEVSDEGIHVDLGESDPQMERPAVNSPAGHTIDACLDALTIAFPDLAAPPRPVPTAEGIRIDPGRGTIAGAELPTATALAPYLTGRAIRHAVLDALSRAGADIPDHDRWWSHRGRDSYRHDIDPETGRLRSERVDEIAERVLARPSAA
jgi:N-methylhydantoinase B/oxoprolinase/acetone carboxylase alpha subunit